MAPKKPSPKYLIDIRGLQAALSSRDNVVAGLVSASISSGEMRLYGDIQDQFHFAELVPKFKKITGKRYERPDDVTYGRSYVLMEQFGAPLIGVDPSNESFEVLAMAMQKNLIIVSAGRSLEEYRAIRHKLSLNSHAPISLQDFKALN